MLVQETVVLMTVILYGCFLLWKFVAMVFGLSYRYKWVRFVDIAALSSVIGLSALIHILWKSLYHPGNASLFYTGVAFFFGLSALFTALSYVVDNARRSIRGSRNKTDV